LSSEGRRAGWAERGGKEENAKAEGDEKKNKRGNRKIMPVGGGRHSDKKKKKIGNRDLSQELGPETRPHQGPTIKRKRPARPKKQQLRTL